MKFPNHLSNSGKSASGFQGFRGLIPYQFFIFFFKFVQKGGGPLHHLFSVHINQADNDPDVMHNHNALTPKEGFVSCKLIGATKLCANQVRSVPPIHVSPYILFFLPIRLQFCLQTEAELIFERTLTSSRH